MSSSTLRSRWAAIGAAVAICLGAGGIGVSQATTSSGDRPVYVPITPCRLADTRPAPDTVGPRSSPLGAGEIYTLDGWGPIGNCSLQPNTSALALNVTAVNPTQLTFLTLWAADKPQPVTSNLNPAPGQPPTPNAVNVALSPSGEFKVFNELGTVNVIIDIVGVYDHHTHDDHYYTETESDARYLSAKQDTFYYVPAALLEIHYDDGPAEVRIDNSGDAIVRKTVSAGDMDVIIPVPFPAQLGGEWAKLVDVRVSYRVNNVSSYINHTWLTKSNNSGGHVDVAQSPGDRKSIGYTSYVVPCSGPECQLAWVPNGNYVTVGLGLRYGGTGSAHDITIGGVLMRVSYDG